MIHTYVNFPSEFYVTKGDKGFLITFNGQYYGGIFYYVYTTDFKTYTNRVFSDTHVNLLNFFENKFYR